MLTEAIEIKSRHLRDEMAFGRSFLSDFVRRLFIEPKIDYDPGLILLSAAYSDEEPEYTDEDLIWRNPNYVKKR